MAHFNDAKIPTWIPGVDRVIGAVGVFVKAGGIRASAFVRILRPEAARIRVVIPGTEVVEAEVGIKLFPAEQVVVRGCASAGEEPDLPPSLRPKL